MKKLYLADSLLSAEDLLFIKGGAEDDVNIVLAQSNLTTISTEGIEDNESEDDDGIIEPPKKTKP